MLRPIILGRVQLSQAFEQMDPKANHDLARRKFDSGVCEVTPSYSSRQAGYATVQNHTDDRTRAANPASLAAVGCSLIYLLFGGGIFGAVVIFCIARAFGRSLGSREEGKCQRTICLTQYKHATRKQSQL